MPPDFPVIGVLAATLGGAAIGVERQRSGKADGANARFGGFRTFTLIGAVSGIAGALAAAGFVLIAAILIAGAIGVVIAAYAAASRRDIDATTEVAALVVIAAGLLAGAGQVLVANAVVAVTVFLLIEKPRLHAFAARIDDEEMRAAARFGVMALVVLPLLPAGPYGPWGGVKPRELWMLVLFFSGLSFVGYLARRAVGASAGYPLAGLLGGLVSSTSVSLTFSRLSRSQPSLSRPLAFGIVAACTTLFPRVLVATLVLNRTVAGAIAPYLAAPFLVGALAIAVGLGRQRRGPEAPDAVSNPLQLSAALQMVAMFQIVLFAVSAVRQTFGDAGLFASGAVLGLTDVDALTVSMTRSAESGVSPELAARAIAIGVLSNTALKAALSIVLGATAVRILAGLVLLLMCAALVASLVIVPRVL